MSRMIPTWVGGDLVAVNALDTHQRGLRHQAVSVFVIHAGEVLLQRRSLSSASMPGIWSCSCWAHPRWGEPPEACAIRRLRQELGITAALPLVARQQVEYRADIGSGMIDHEVVDVFVADMAEKPRIAFNPDHVLDVEWCSVPALFVAANSAPGNYTPWLRTCLSDYRDGLFL